MSDDPSLSDTGQGVSIRATGGRGAPANQNMAPNAGRVYRTRVVLVDQPGEPLRLIADQLEAPPVAVDVMPAAGPAAANLCRA